MHMASAGSGFIRRISPLNLLLISINGMLGSAWLFAPLYVAQMAGSMAIWAWITGGIMTLAIAWCFAQLSTYYPVTGGSAQLPAYTHGSLMAFFTGWLGGWSAIAMAPIEIQAVLQYLSYFFPALMHKNAAGVTAITGWGMLVACSFMALFGWINGYSFAGFARWNRWVSLFKACIMVWIIVAFSQAQFYPEHVIPYWPTQAADWRAVFAAVSMAGVAFAFTGFKHGVEMAGESENPRVAIPLAVLGSVIICLLLYIGIQMAFMGAIAPEQLHGGWSQLRFAGDFGPLAGLASVLGLGLIFKLLYADAIVSPLGTGMIYTGSTARITYTLAEMGFLPAAWARLNAHGLPIRALGINLGVGLLLFLPFPGWQALVEFLMSGMVVAYGIGPIMLYILETARTPPRIRRIRRQALCVLAFYCCNLIAYWCGWPILWKLSLITALGGVIFYRAWSKGKMDRHPDRVGFASLYWWIPYWIGLLCISYAGTFGGRGWLPFGWDFGILAVFSGAIFAIAVKTARPNALSVAPDPILACGTRRP